MYIAKKNNDDIKYILDNLRDQDVNELQTEYMLGWRQLVYKRTIKLNNEHCFIGYSKDNKPVLMFGIVPVNDIGVIWMLSTQDITEQTSFIRLAKKFIKENEKKYRILCNFVYKENTLAIKWLKSLGFSFNYEYKEKENFLFFYKENK